MKKTHTKNTQKTPSNTQQHPKNTHPHPKTQKTPKITKKNTQKHTKKKHKKKTSKNTTKNTQIKNQKHPKVPRFSFNFLIRNFSGCFDTNGSMIPRLVPEIEGVTLSVTEKEKEQKDWS